MLSVTKMVSLSGSLLPLRITVPLKTVVKRDCHQTFVLNFFQLSYVHNISLLKKVHYNDLVQERLMEEVKQSDQANQSKFSKHILKTVFLQSFKCKCYFFDLLVLRQNI